MVEKRKTSDNIKHYINELMDGNSFFTGNLIYKKAVISTAMLHAIAAVLSLLAGSILMTIVNAVVFLFLVTFVISLVNKERYMTVYFIMILGIIIFTIFCNLVIGWESGYSVQFFSAISGSFYFTFVIKSEKRKSLSLTFCVTLLLSYILSYILSQMLAPIAPLSPTWTRVFFIMNAVISFSIIIMLSYLFVWELLNKQKILTMQNEQLDELAHKDPLTHLLNRRSMNEKMTLRMEQLKLTGKRFTLVIGDIDDFKKVNDNYGHEAGDIVLITVSDIIRQNVGGGGFVCRWGGEEILMVLNESLESATEVTDRIRKRIDENIVNHEGNQIHVSMTFGVAESIPGYKIEHLIQQADDRLYYGKKHGKNQVVTSIPEG